MWPVRCSVFCYAYSYAPAIAACFGAQADDQLPYSLKVYILFLLQSFYKVILVEFAKLLLK